VNLVDGALEIDRDPNVRENRWDDRLARRLMPEDSPPPLQAPTAVIPMVDLLP
jgi:hypothetical protein